MNQDKISKCDPVRTSFLVFSSTRSLVMAASDSSGALKQASLVFGCGLGFVNGIYAIVLQRGGRPAKAIAVEFIEWKHVFFFNQIILFS